MVGLRHKRSKANININISFPVPSSATTLVFDENGTPQPIPLQQPQQRSKSPSPPMESRFSGEHLTPRDGYSTLFTSGLNPIMPLPSPTLSSFPSPPRTSPRKPALSHMTSYGHHLSPAANNTSPVRRRRSSIIHTTPSSTSPKKLKSAGVDGGVERALDNVMRSLKLVAMGTPRGKYDYDDRALQESRWSSSTDNTTRPSLDTTQDSSNYSESFFKPRKSSETQRSRAPSRATVRSTKSKGRKSEDTDRMDIDIGGDVGIPDLPPLPLQNQTPTTPGRSKRMVQGLVRRLRLTPKKSRGSPAPAPNSPPPLPLPLPPLPTDRNLPRKSSLSTLRSALTKKGSTTTLRSVRSVHQIPHPFAMSDDQPLPLPLPGLPQPPHTPRSRSGSASASGRRTPKSSIGQPKLQPETSPSFFLDKMPRRAPETPERSSTCFEHHHQQITPAAAADTDGVIRFETEGVSPHSAEFEVGDMTMGEADDSMDQTREEIFTPSTSNITKNPMVAIAVSGLDSPFAPVSQSTPVLSLAGTGTPILTAKAARATDSAPKPRRLLSLLPKHQQKLDSPSPSLSRHAKGYQPMPLGLRSENLTRARQSLDKNSGFNSLGLPIPKKNHTSTSLKQGSRRDPLGIIRRLGDRDRERGGSETIPEMPFLSGAGDGWGTPALPSQSRVSLGTKESYFDHSYNHNHRVETDTFGRNVKTGPSPSSSAEMTKARSAIPDFSAPPAPSSSASTTSSIPIDEREGSPEYSFHLELDPSANERFADEPSYSNNEISISSNTSVHGLDWDNIRAAPQGQGMPKMSQRSIDSVSMTTGEGVEEWELERYLKDLKNEDFKGSERVAT